MYDAGIKSPPYPNAAHHIVPTHTEYCPTASGLLEEYGISKNAAVNGVFLPYKHNKYVTTESMHTGNHLRSYYKTIESRFIYLKDYISKNNYSYDKVQHLICKELEKIREELFLGKILTNNSK